MKKIITIMLALVLLVSAGATDGAYVKDAKAFSILPEDESVNISEPSTENTYELDEDKPYLLLPLTVEKTGTVKFTVSFQGFTETAWVNLRTDADMDAIGEVERTLKLLEPETSAGCTLSYTFTEANTYYLFILLRDSDQTKAGSVTLKTTFSAASSDSEAKPSTSTSTSSASTQAAQKTPATVKWKSVKNTAKKKVTVQWKKAASVTGYQIQYASKKNFNGKKTITVKGASKTKSVISGCAKKKTYYFRIRAYVVSGGKNCYGNWSATKSVKITK